MGKKVFKQTICCVKKIFFIFCATFLVMLLAFCNFGGFAEMEKCCVCCIVAGVAGFFFIFFVAIAFFCCCCCGKNDRASGKIEIVPFEKKFSAERLNKSFFVDKDNMTVPEDRTIVFVKAGIDFNIIDFKKPDGIKELHFCASKISISTGRLQELINAKVFLGYGKRKIKIVHTPAQKSGDDTNQTDTTTGGQK